MDFITTITVGGMPFRVQKFSPWRSVTFTVALKSSSAGVMPVSAGGPPTAVIIHPDELFHAHFTDRLGAS